MMALYTSMYSVQRRSLDVQGNVRYAEWVFGKTCALDECQLRPEGGQ